MTQKDETLQEPPELEKLIVPAAADCV